MVRGDDMCCHQTEGDPTASTTGSKSSFPELDGLDAYFAEAANAPGDCGNPMELPPWFQWDKFKRGQNYFYKNIYSLFVAKLAGLITVLAIPSILRVLVFTRQSGDACSAFRRYASTLAHMCDWYRGDLLEPASKAYQSLNTVRTKHAAAARRSRKAGLGLVSQLDMVLTQFGFMGFTLLSPNKIGAVPASPEEIEGFLHFWRTVGYFLGIEDRFNLCSGTEAQTRALCVAMRDRIFREAMARPPQDFDVMSRALVSGMRCTIPSLDYDAFIRFIKCDLLGIEDKTKLSLWSRFTLGQMRFVNSFLLRVRAFACFIRPFINANIKLAVYLTGRYPFLAYWRFGKKQVHV